LASASRVLVKAQFAERPQQFRDDAKRAQHLLGSAPAMALQ
jgi:hypothetical protein